MAISLRTARLTGMPATIQDQPVIESIYAENVGILRPLAPRERP